MIRICLLLLLITGYFGWIHPLLTQKPERDADEDLEPVTPPTPQRKRKRSNTRKRQSWNEGWSSEDSYQHVHPVDKSVVWVSGETSISHLPERTTQKMLGCRVPGGKKGVQKRIAKSQKMAMHYEKSAGFRQMKRMSLGLLGASVPSEYDPRTEGFTTPVKDQGGCGSCVGFGTVAAMETTAKRMVHNPNLEIDLSESDLFFCIGDCRCSQGWFLQPALEAAKQGVADEQTRPYREGRAACDISQPIYKIGVAEYKAMGSIEEMQEWLATRGSLLASLAVYDDFMSYREGVYFHQSGGLAGYHAIAIEGYGEGYWLCKNSWGEGWGEQGYFKIKFGECGIESDAWGIAELSGLEKLQSLQSRIRSKSRSKRVKQRAECRSCTGVIW